ncbi:MAG: alpha/beta hydrolase [Bacteroidales bacterium]|nr:alpha/beta hydrolase [Bacteroidales bacterium]MBR5670330.1 alpha/beta hydrolase [Bacteroidales bacterium]
MKRSIISITAIAAVTVLSLLSAQAQPAGPWDSTKAFAVRDTQTLCLDFYFPEHWQQSDTLRPCMIFVYGGGFVDNNQRSGFYTKFCRAMADAGYVTVASDYRLGLKDFHGGSLLKMIEPVRNSIQMATEDLFAATDYIIRNAESLRIDTSKIILCGSSAGAISVLQANYELSNRTEMTAAIPDDFRFAGVISFSGAVFSSKGECKYPVHDPAPTFFLHGDTDRLVPYNKIQLFRKGMFGSKPLAAGFQDAGYPYFFATFTNHSHEVAGFQMEQFDAVLWFIDHYVNKGEQLQIDMVFTDMDHKIGKVYANPQQAYSR